MTRHTNEQTITKSHTLKHTRKRTRPQESTYTNIGNSKTTTIILSTANATNIKNTKATTSQPRSKP